MHEAEVKRIVAEAVRRERGVWLILTILIMALSTSLQTPFRISDCSSGSQFTTTARPSRRILQQEDTPAPFLDKETASESLGTDQLQLAELTLAPQAEVEYLKSPAAEPGDYTVSTGEDIKNTTAAVQQCICPPAPQGPAGPQGEPAPAFLNNIFSYNENSGALTVTATTIELTGSLVIRGYCGVKQSLFVGGDPSKGESSTEVAGGQILMYGDKGAVISGFSTTPQGTEISKVTIQGQLLEDSEGKGEGKRVATKLF